MHGIYTFFFILLPNVHIREGKVFQQSLFLSSVLWDKNSRFTLQGKKQLSFLEKNKTKRNQNMKMKFFVTVNKVQICTVKGMIHVAADKLRLNYT